MTAVIPPRGHHLGPGQIGGRELERGTAPSQRVVFANSRFACFVYQGRRLVGVGRALADGADCSYIADVAVHPDHQGAGLGRAIVEELIGLSRDHKKIILYASPGTEPFYAKLGFLPMRTAMGIFRNRRGAFASGVLAPHR